MPSDLFINDTNVANIIRESAIGPATEELRKCLRELLEFAPPPSSMDGVEAKARYHAALTEAERLGKE